MTLCAVIRLRHLAVVACVLLICHQNGRAADRIEQTSVIPIGSKSEEHVGKPISVKTLNSGTSSRRTKQAAIEEFPISQMEECDQAVVRDIFSELSLFRRLPTIQLEADRRCYEYFTNHPDVAVSIWRAMEISKVQMKQTGDREYATDTNDGTKGEVRVLLNTPDHYVVTCQGEFKSPAIKKPIQATAMMHLRPKFHAHGVVTHQLDMYVSFPSNTIEAIARFISPVSNRIADRNFEEISLFVEMMSLAMSRQPGWVEQLTQKLEGIDPGETESLLKLTAAIYVDAVRAERATTSKTFDIKDVLPPTQAVGLQEGRGSRVEGLGMRP